MGGQEARANVLAHVHWGLELVDRLRSRLAYHASQDNVAKQLDAGLLNGLAGEKEGGQRSLVVHHAPAEERVALAPR